MSKTNVGANLMFALRIKTFIKPMFENELETFASDIGSQTIVVRRGEHKARPYIGFGHWLDILRICMIADLTWS